MLRIHFSNEDIARTRIAPAPDPFWELVSSIHMLRGQPGDLLFTEWRRSTVAALRRSGVDRASRMLWSLVPTLGYFPDFLTPARAAGGFDDGMDAIRSTPVSVLRHELGRVVVPSNQGRSVRILASGDSDAMRHLTEGARKYYDTAISPHRSTVDGAIARDRAQSMEAMAAGGVEAVLSRLKPWASFSGGELRIPSHQDQSIDLAGRGLLLIPSFFCVNHPMTLFDASLSPVLVHPINHGGAPFTPRRDTPEPLGALIGNTRAAVLREIAGVSTLDIARRVGIATASASEHATVLRAAGLIVSHRDGNRMLHHLTPLGLSLLNQSHTHQASGP